MNTINENEVRLANLKASADKRRAEFCDIRAEVTRQIAKIIEDAVAASGVSGYTLRKGENGELRDTEYMTLDGEIDGERLHDIDLYYRNDSWRDEDGGERVFSVNTCCFGRVKAGDKSGVAYYLLMGYLVTHLQEIQDALNAIPDWEAYNRSRRIYHISRNDAEAFERKMDAEAKMAKEAAVLERLMEGAEIAVHYTTDFDLVRGVHVLTGIKIMTVEKVTNKLVFFKDRRGQNKKADVVANLVRGIDNCGWSFAADVDMAFPRDCKDGANF